MILCSFSAWENQGTESLSSWLTVTQPPNCRLGIPTPHSAECLILASIRVLAQFRAMVIYGRKEENVAGSKIGAFGKVVIFPPQCICMQPPSFLSWMECLLYWKWTWFCKYIFIWRATPGLRGKGTGESNERDLVPGPDTEPDQWDRKWCFVDRRKHLATFFFFFFILICK